MFVVRDIKQVEWPVVVNVPIDGGKVSTHRCYATFELLDSDSLQDLTRECKGDDVQVMLRVIVGWRDICDEDNRPIPFSSAELKTLLVKDYVRTAFVTAFNKALYGIVEKN